MSAAAVAAAAVSSLADLPEGDSCVGGGDLLPVDDLGLLEPLVRLAELDGLPVGRLVAELGEGLELVLQGLVVAAAAAAAGCAGRRGAGAVVVLVTHALIKVAHCKKKRSQSLKTQHK